MSEVLSVRTLTLRAMQWSGDGAGAGPKHAQTSDGQYDGKWLQLIWHPQSVALELTA